NLAPVLSCRGSFPRQSATATQMYSLSLHDALPIYRQKMSTRARRARSAVTRVTFAHHFKGVSLLKVAIATGRTHQIRVHLNAIRSEEHTSELQSRENIVCRLLLEKKNNPASRAGPA